MPTATIIAGGETGPQPDFGRSAVTCAIEGWNTQVLCEHIRSLQETRETKDLNREQYIIAGLPSDRFLFGSYPNRVLYCDFLCMANSNYRLAYNL